MRWAWLAGALESGGWFDFSIFFFFRYYYYFYCDLMFIFIYASFFRRIHSRKIMLYTSSHSSSFSFFLLLPVSPSLHLSIFFSLVVFFLLSPFFASPILSFPPPCFLFPSSVFPLPLLGFFDPTVHFPSFPSPFLSGPPPPCLFFSPSPSSLFLPFSLSPLPRFGSRRGIVFSPCYVRCGFVLRDKRF